MFGLFAEERILMKNVHGITGLFSMLSMALLFLTWSAASSAQVTKL